MGREKSVNRVLLSTLAGMQMATLSALLLPAAIGCRMVSQGRNVDGVRYFQQAQYTEALPLDGRIWRPHAGLGGLKEQAGDYPQALQNCQLAYSINRFQPELQRQIAALQSRVGPAQAGVTPPANSATGTRSASGVIP